MKKILHSLVLAIFCFSLFLISPVQKVNADISFDIGVNEEFLQPNIAAGGTSTLRIYFYNTNTFQVLLGTSPAALTYTLPANVYFSDPISITNTCGGLITYSGTTLSLIGGTIPQMANGTQGTCNISIQLTSTISTTYYSHINSNSVNATDPDGNLVTNSKGTSDVSLTVSAVQPPSLSKTFSPNTIWAGQTSTMGIRITNTDSQNSLTKVSVTDAVPSGITLSTTNFTSSNCGSPNVTQVNGNALTTSSTDLKVNNATIAPSTTCVVNFTVTSVTPGIYLNSIPAGAVKTQQGVTNAAAASAPLNVQNISLTKAFSPSTVMVGGQSKLTITMQNPTNGDYTDVNFTDNLPSGMTVVPGTLATTCAAGSVTTNASNATVAFSGGTITKSTSCTVTAMVTIAVAGSYTNSIPAGGLHVGSTGITNISAATANLSSYASGQGMTGSKSFSPTTIPVGGTSRMTVNIKAPQDVDYLHHVTVTDALPVGLVVASSPSVQTSNCGTPTFSPLPGDTTLSFSNGTIKGNVTCTFSVMVVAAAPGTYTNVVSATNITNDEGRDISGTLSATLTVSGISVTKAFFPTAINQGNISTLTIQLTNTNTDQLNSVTFLDSLPANLVVADDGVTRNYVNTCGGSLTNSSGSSLALNDTSIKLVNGIIPAQVGSVPGTCTINVDVKANTVGDKNNSIGAGKVSGILQTSGITITNPSATSATLHVLDLTITINKSFSPVSVTGGGTSTLSVYLYNPNNYVLNGVGFTDNLTQSGTGTSGMHIAPAANAHLNTGDTCAGTISATPGANSFSYSGGTLAVGGHCTVNVDVVMDYDGNLTNTIPVGSVTSTNGAANPLAGVATLYNSPGAYLVKTFWNINANAHTAQMTIEITNDYTYRITGIKFTDTLPTGMNLTSAAAAQCNGTVATTTGSLALTGGWLDPGQSCSVVASVYTPTAGTYENCVDDSAMQIDQKDSGGNVITNHGKACDTLTTTDVVVPPTVTKSFSPTSIPLGNASAMSFVISNSNNVALANVAFSDVLPAGLSLTSVPNPSQCSGTVNWDSSTGTLSLSGGSLAAKGSCTVIASVTGASSTVYPNSVTVTATSGTDTLTSNTSNASLTVVAPPQISKTFNSDSITANGTSVLIFDILNPATNSAALTGVGFVDNLPTGVQVTTSPTITKSTDCGSATFAPAAGATTLTLTGASIPVGKTCEVTVTVTASNGGTYVNTTQAVTSTNGGTGNTATDTLTVLGPGLTLDKTTSTANYKALNDPISYTYTLTNTGSIELYAPFQVADDHIGSPLNTPFDCGTATELAPNESTTCTATYNVNATDLAAKSVKNVATATAATVADGTGLITSNLDSVTVNEAKLTIDKTTSAVSYYSSGTKITYTYMLTNTGNVTLYSPFQVSDDHIGSPLGTPFTCGSATQLTPGANVSCTAQYTVAAGDLGAAVTGITNVAFATAKDAGSLTVTSNNDSVTVPKLNKPTIAKSFTPDTIAIGQTSTMTVTIYNPTWSDTNLVPLTGVAFSDTFPSGMTVVVTPDTAQCGGTVAWNGTTGVLSLSGGSVIGPSCTITALVTANSAQVFTNTTSKVTTTNSAQSDSTASATLTVVQGATIAKSFSPTSVLQGQTSTLTLVITNPVTNTKALTGIAFTDALPAGMTVASDPNIAITNCGASPVFAPAAGASSFSFSGGDLAIGGNCTLSVDVIAPAAGQYLNTTSAITSTNGGTGATSNTATLNVLKSADLQITKTDGIADVNRSEVVHYTIVATNAGPSDAVGASVTDNIPSNLTGAAWSCVATGGASCTSSGSGNISDTVNLPVGGTVTYTVTATVTSGAISGVVNTAAVVPPSDLSDTNPLNNIATDVDALNLLSIDKTGVPSTYSTIGSSINYTYTVTNSGTSTLKSPFMVYDDKLTPTCSSLPATLAPGASFTCTGSHELTNADLDASSITNQAYATGKDNDGDTITSNTDTVTVISNQIPLIGLAKEATKIKLVDTGTYDVTFTYKVQNYGNVTLHNVLATDNLVSAFPASGISSFAVTSISSTHLTVNSAFNGNSNQNLLLSGNSLAAGESETLQVVVRVIPLSHGPFYNSASVSALSPIGTSTSDVSQDGTNPDADGNGNPTNDSVPTPVDFGSPIFDPMVGNKYLDDSQMPVMGWSMVWINNANIVPVYSIVYDPIPENTVFIDTVKVVCTANGKSVTKNCYYEDPSVAYPRGRIVWEGTIAPDYGVKDPMLASNSIQITFSTEAGNASYITNTATINTDLNGDGDTTDSGEVSSASATADWTYKPVKLPTTGFAPGVITTLPAQPKALNYDTYSDMWLEIPRLNVQSDIIGVPQTESGWNITWLGKETGWLNGTAFPTHDGNAVLTGHIVNADGQPGPFANLNKLKYGDRIVIHAFGQEYIYEVRETKTIAASDTQSALKHETNSWVTLMTCSNYDAKIGTYLSRYIVRAVLIQVK